MEDVDLLPCPFCGSPAFAADIRQFDEGDPSFVVHCRGCNAQTAPCVYPSVERSRAEAMHRWNQRVVVVDDGSFLLPCPCCGSEANAGHVDYSSPKLRELWGNSYDSMTSAATGRYLVAVSCKACGLFSKPFNYADYNRSRSDAVHAWNRRSGDVLTVPTKPDLTGDKEYSKSPDKPKSKLNIIVLVLFVILLASYFIIRYLPASL